MRIDVTMIINSLMCATALLALGGCARPGMMGADSLREQDSVSLCRGYHASDADPEIRRELERRGQLTEREWQAIDAEEIFVGMSELGLFCAWGGPGLYGTVITTSGSDGVHKQYVYREYHGAELGYSKPRYVQVQNGVVTSWQT